LHEGVGCQRKPRRALEEGKEVKERPRGWVWPVSRRDEECFTQVRKRRVCGRDICGERGEIIGKGGEKGTKALTRRGLLEKRVQEQALTVCESERNKRE